MKYIPTRVYSAAQVRHLDRVAIDDFNIPGYTLMTRAGEAALACLHEHWPQARRILILCGAGNNAGDGYVLARLAIQDAKAVTIVQLTKPTHLQGDAAKAWSDYAKKDDGVREWDPTLLDHADVVVDALLGTGLDRPLKDHYREIVTAVNDADVPVLALDVPTGLDADRGVVLGAAVEADATMTFVGLKTGFYLGVGPDYSGHVCYSGLGIPAGGFDNQPFEMSRIDTQVLPHVFRRRRRTTHKGANGRVLIVGGGTGMPGAVRLASEAALRIGAGLVTVATLETHVPVIVSARPEVMCRGADDPEDVHEMIAQADVIAIGPGLGSDAWADTLMQMVLASDKPLIIDADGLNWLARNPLKRDNWILTPHSSASLPVMAV